MAMTAAGHRVLEAARDKDRQLELPWEGRSPRHLTEAWERFRLQREKTTVIGDPEWDEEFLDQQCRRHHYGS